MKRLILCVLLGITMAGGLYAARTPDFYRDGMFYGRGTLQIGWHDDLLYDASPINARICFDTGYGMSAAFGYTYDQFSFELEGLFNWNRLDEVSHPSGQDIITTNGDIMNTALMLNALFDIPMYEELGMYVGGGLGIVYSTLDISSVGESDDFLFAWQALAGLSYELTECISLNLGYRLFMTDKVNYPTTADELGRESDDIALRHSMDAGIKIML